MSVNDVLIAQVLTLSQKSESVIANNLANAETPGFKASRFEFQNRLNAAVKQGANQVAQVRGTVVAEPGQQSANGNNVSLTGEMVALVHAQLVYRTALAAQSHEMKEIQIVTEGRAL